MTDGLRAEREQGITIDVAYRYFATPLRKFIIADTPGHVQYTRNMVTGNSTADLTIVLVDARKGIVEQTRRHAFLASLLRVPHLVVCVNKMDLVDYDQQVFESIRVEFSAFASRLEITDLTFIPISALEGDNVVQRSANMSWYEGASLLHHLESVYIAADRNLIDPRLPVQWVVRPKSVAYPDYRGYAGMIAGGVFRAGDDVTVVPSGLSTTIVGIDSFDGPVDEAFPPDVGSGASGERLGHLARRRHLPPAQPAGGGPGHRRHGLLDDRPTRSGRRLPRAQAHKSLGPRGCERHPLPTRREHASPRRVCNSSRFERGRTPYPSRHSTDLLRQLSPEPLDRLVHSRGRGYERHLRGRDDLGAGLTAVADSTGPGGASAKNLTWHEGRMRRDERWETLRIAGGTVSVHRPVGLRKIHSGHGSRAESRKRRPSGYRLDGDNLRSGLNADLDFSGPGTRENIRRASQRWPVCSRMPVSWPWWR